MQSPWVLDRHGDSWERMYFYHNLRHLYSIIGDTKHEIESARVEMQIGETVDDPEGTCWGAYGIANALARSGNLDEAHQYMERALGIMTGRTNIVVLPTALQTYGFVHLQSGDYKAACEVLEVSCRNIWRDWSFVDYTVRAFPLLVECMLGPTWYEEAPHSNKNSLWRVWRLSFQSMFWARRFPNYLPHALRVRGRAASAMGKKGKAIACLRRAVRFGETIGARYDVARSYIDLAKLDTSDNKKHEELGRHILAEIAAVLPASES